MQKLKIYAEWENEAAVWVVTSKDLSGLAFDVNTIDELSDPLKMVIPEQSTFNRKDAAGNKLPFVF